MPYHDDSKNSSPCFVMYFIISLSNTKLLGDITTKVVYPINFVVKQSQSSHLPLVPESEGLNGAYKILMGKVLSAGNHYKANTDSSHHVINIIINNQSILRIV